MSRDSSPGVRQCGERRTRTSEALMGGVEVGDPS